MINWSHWVAKGVECSSFLWDWEWDLVAFMVRLMIKRLNQISWDMRNMFRAENGNDSRATYNVVVIVFTQKIKLGHIWIPLVYRLSIKWAWQNMFKEMFKNMSEGRCHLVWQSWKYELISLMFSLCDHPPLEIQLKWKKNFWKSHHSYIYKLLSQAPGHGWV